MGFSLGQIGISRDPVLNPTQPLTQSNSAGSIFGKIGSTIGGLLSGANEEQRNDEQIASAEAAMQWESAEAQKNRDWQEQMSNTAHQRAVTDLKEAGLNPILAAGSAASTPGGAAGGGFQAGIETKGNQALSLIGSALKVASSALRK